MGSQSQLFKLTIRYETDKNQRPETGYSVYQDSPKGLAPVTSTRGKLIKKKTFEESVLFCSTHYPGYSLDIDVHGFHGVIK